MEDDFAGFPGRLAETRVAILGLGLMGGSLALALRSRCAALLAVDPDPVTRRQALDRGLVDACSADPSEILLTADLIVLAAPVSTILELLGQLPGLHPGRAVVLDLGSTKREICTLMAGLPERLAPVGGHPMCGKESAGLANAEAGLYHGAPFALVELPNTTPAARRTALELVEALGAHPLWLDPVTHDRWAAAVSHLPYLLAITLAHNTSSAAAVLAGPGWRSTARLAGSPRQMMLDILVANRENVLSELGRYRKTLLVIEQALSGLDIDRLAELLEQGAQQYGKIMDAAAPAAVQSHSSGEKDAC